MSFEPMATNSILYLYGGEGLELELIDKNSFIESCNLFK
jgi:hypothetical protein